MRRSVVPSPLFILLMVAILPPNALAQAPVAAEAGGHSADPGNSPHSPPSTAAVLTETFDDPLGGWRTRWLATNTNMTNYYLCAGDSGDENYRGNNPCGLWICDDNPNNAAIITLAQPWGASIRRFEIGIQAFVDATYTIYDPDGVVVYASSLPINYSGPYSCSTTPYVANTPSGIGRFEITSSSQVEGNMAIDNVSADVGDVTALLSRSWGSVKAIYR